VAGSSTVRHAGAVVTCAARDAAADVPSGPAMTYAIIAKNPKLKIPSRSRTRNQALLSSWDVFRSAPIHERRPPIIAPTIAKPPAMPSPSSARASGPPWTPTTFEPFMTNNPFACASPTAMIRRMAPAPAAMTLPMKSLVTVALDMGGFLSVEVRPSVGCDPCRGSSSRSGQDHVARGDGGAHRVMRHLDDDGSASVSARDVLDRLGGTVQWIHPSDDGGDPSSLDQLLQGDQVVPVLGLHRRLCLLPDEDRDEHRSDSAEELAVGVSPSIRDQRSVWFEDAPRPCHRVVAHVIEDEVVATLTRGEVDSGVVDHVVGADRSDHIDVLRAGHRGDLSAHGLRDLDGEGADAARRPIDQDLMTR